MNRTSMPWGLSLLALAVTGTLALNACANQNSSANPTLSAQTVQGNVYYSAPSPIGQGQIRSYLKVAQSGRPIEIGVKFSAAALQNLPMHPQVNENCFDMNSDGQIDAHMECALGYVSVLPIPDQARSIAKTPFKYAMIDFNSMGHQPPGIYDVPHFDFHFYLQPNEERQQIRLGPCAEVVNCDDMATAQKPLPAQYQPPGVTDVGAVMGLMGNHLINLQSPEFHGQPFTHTWIWGTYNAKLTFFEPMITVAYLNTKPKAQCFSYGMPQKFQEAGYYPTQYCINYNSGQQEYTVSLENFKYYGQ